MTGVPVDRMKVIAKGVMLKDDWGRIPLGEGKSFTVLGIAGELPKPPEKKTVFVEGSVLDNLRIRGSIGLSPVVRFRCRYG